MSGEEVEAHAGLAEGQGSASNAEAELTVRGHGRAQARKSHEPGRPPGLTDFRDEGRLGETIRRMARDKVKITRPTLAANLGITEAALRGYLLVSGRTMRAIVAQYSPR